MICSVSTGSVNVSVSNGSLNVFASTGSVIGCVSTVL